MKNIIFFSSTVKKPYGGVKIIYQFSDDSSKELIGRISLKMKNESKEVTYDLILEQLGRRRWEGNPESSYYRVIREARLVKGKQI